MPVFGSSRGRPRGDLADHKIGRRLNKVRGAPAAAHPGIDLVTATTSWPRPGGTRLRPPREDRSGRRSPAPAEALLEGSLRLVMGPDDLPWLPGRHFRLIPAPVLTTRWRPWPVTYCRLGNRRRCAGSGYGRLYLCPRAMPPTPGPRILVGDREKRTELIGNSEQARGRIGRSFGVVSSRAASCPAGSVRPTPQQEASPCGLEECA